MMNENLQNTDEIDLLSLECNQLSIIPTFPSDVLKYMKQNATGRQICKLMKLNKYFYQHFRPKEIQHYALVKFHHKKWMFSTFDKPEEYLFNQPISNVWYTDRLWLSAFSDFFNAFPPSCTCNLKDLRIHDCTMSIEDFFFLTSAKKVEMLFLESTIIVRGDGNDASFEDILRCLPSITHIELISIIPSLDSLIAVKKVLPLKLCFIDTWGLPNAYGEFKLFMKKYKQINYRLHYDASMFFQEAVPKYIKHREQ